jgi:tRNA 2-(methylsulfanyl)-N6-isopentenyladenosine37 hydroxylase
MFCLRVPTDPSWAKDAAKDLNAVLVDHAHCEMKAASNAMSLVMRHPGDLSLVRALSSLAYEELEHFRRVTGFLDRRGLPLGAPPKDEYAAELRKAVAKLPRALVPSLTDRLLVGALIEARSCERFKLLLEALPSDTEPELRAFYEELFAPTRHTEPSVPNAMRKRGPSRSLSAFPLWPTRRGASWRRSQGGRSALRCTADGERGD